MTRGRVLRFAGAACAAVALICAVMMLPLASWLTILTTVLHGTGLYGAALFLVVYVTGVTLFVPAWMFSIAAGLLYGTWGILLSWCAMMAAACVGLVLVRGAVASSVRDLVHQRPRLRIVADAIDQEGWRMVLLVRVSGIVPFGVQNFVFGITRVHFLPYALATSVGVLPGVVLHAGAGALGQATLAGPEASALRLVVFGLSALAAFALVFVTARRIRARLT